MTEIAASSQSQPQSAPPAPQSQEAPQAQSQAAPAPSAGNTLLNGGQGQGSAAPAPAQSQAPTTPEDWRARFAGEDPKALEIFSRYKSEAEFGRAFLEQRTTLSKRAEMPKLPDNATPEQITEYRKAMGVPAEPTLEAYGVKAPDGYTLAEPEKAMLGEFIGTMHGKHAPAGVVKEAVDFYFKSQAAAEQGAVRVDVQKQQEWQRELQNTLGRDFEPMVAAGEAFLNSHFADKPEAKNELLNARLPGGGRLGDHPAFISLISDLALKNGFTDRIEATAMESGGKSLEQQQRDIEALRRTDPKLYNEPGTQAKLDKIIALRLSKGEIDESGNPAKKRRYG